MKALLFALCLLVGLAGCQHRVANDAELRGKYIYVFVDAGFSIALCADHSYVYDTYSPFTIPSAEASAIPPMEVGRWDTDGNILVLTATTGGVRQLGITRKEGRLALSERISDRVVWTYFYSRDVFCQPLPH